MIKLYCSGDYKPKYGTKGSAGLDLPNNDRHLEIEPNDIVKVQTKVHVEIPDGYVGIVATRSGLGFRGLDLINSIGVIDSDFRGDIGLKFINRGKDTIVIEYGERIAQLVVVPYLSGFKEVDNLDELDFTERGLKGFGSTGKI